MKSYSAPLPQNKKCEGCGAVLNDRSGTLGFTPVIPKAKLCQRCFQLQNYGKSSATINSLIQSETQATLATIDVSVNAIFYVCDLTMVPFYVSQINELMRAAPYFKLIISKSDLISLSRERTYLTSRVMGYLQRLQLAINEHNVIITSAVKKINYLQVYEAILAASSQNLKVCFYGPTNAGKSSLINWVINHEKLVARPLTVSATLNTTQGLKQVKTRDFVLIDLPGVNDEHNLQSQFSITRITQTIGKETGLRNYQLRNDTLFIGENLFWIEVVVQPNKIASVTFYTWKNILIHHSHLKNAFKLQASIHKTFTQPEPIAFDTWHASLFTCTNTSATLIINGLALVTFKNAKSINVKCPVGTTLPCFLNDYKI